MRKASYSDNWMRTRSWSERLRLRSAACSAGTVRSTPSEDHLLGEARDRLVGSAKELTQDTMHKVGRVAEVAQSAAKQEAKDQALVAEAS